MEDRVEGLARRVRRMERELCVYRAAAVLAAVLVAGGGLASGHAASRPATPRPPDAELRARRFTLVGADGQALAALEPATGQGSRLSLLGAGGVVRLSLEVSADGSPAVALNDGSGRKRVALEVGADEARVTVLGLGQTAVTLANGGVAPRLAVADAAGHDRVWLAVRLGSPVLQFLDAQGIARTGISTFNDDTGLAVISGTDRKRPGLVLLDKDRAVAWSAP